MKRLLIATTALLLIACGSNEPDVTIAAGPFGGTSDSAKDATFGADGFGGSTDGTDGTTDTDGTNPNAGTSDASDGTSSETSGRTDTQQGEDASSQTFDPDVLSLSVTSGPKEGGTKTVVVTLGFEEDFRVTEPEILFGDTPCTQINAITRGVVEVTTPPGEAGKTVDVTVKSMGEKATLKEAFTYVDMTETPVTDYVLITLGSAEGPSGAPAPVPVKLTVMGNAKPAALLVDVKVDLIYMPIASPSVGAGKVHTEADKQLAVNAKKNDEVSMVVLGKNRNVLKDGTVATLLYSIPPAPAWTVTPVTVSAQAVDGLGNPIVVKTESAWVGISPKEASQR